MTSPSNQDAKLYLIVGNGPAGIATALHLQNSGRKCLVIAPELKMGEKVGESLPSGCAPLLQRLGIESLLESGPHFQFSGNLSCWGQDQLDEIDFLQDPGGLGWRLDRALFEQQLISYFESRQGKIIEAEVREINKTESGYSLNSTAGEFNGEILIDATGRKSFVARKLGADREKDPTVFAAIDFMKSNSPDQRTLVEAVQDGWWYTSLLPNGKRVVSHHCLADKAKNLANDRKLFLNELNKTLHVSQTIDCTYENQKINRTDDNYEQKLLIKEACGSSLNNYCGPGWFAVGDAAIAFDPISSQGLLNAFATAYALVKVLDEESPEVAYQTRLSEIRRIAVNRQRLVYAAETRFLNHPFWLHQLGISV